MFQETPIADTQCAYCYRWLHILTDGKDKRFCEHSQCQKLYSAPQETRITDTQCAYCYGGFLYILTDGRSKQSCQRSNCQKLSSDLSDKFTIKS
jgi:hypothetical protein